MHAFVLQYQSGAVVTDTIWLMKPNLLTIWIFIGKNVLAPALDPYFHFLYVWWLQFQTFYSSFWRTYLSFLKGEEKKIDA